MKNKLLNLILLILVIFLGLFLGKVSLDNEIKEKDLALKNNNTLSMMLETDYNSNNYVSSTSNEWPTSGYIFNEELSRCEYGSKLSWDDETYEVLMTGNSSDKCYVYFDKYELPIINSSSAVVSGTKIVITIDATAGTSAIANYYYSIDNGKSYIKSTSSTYTFTNLAIGDYTIKYYVEDTNGIKSKIILKEASVIPLTLTNYVISQYTGIQGENNLYYHDPTLENGAGDNSYRYAGSSDTTNNFVCFGSDATTCPNDNLYRIIGVFGDQVKLIKWDYATTTLLGADGGFVNTYSESWYNSGTNKGNNLTSSIGSYKWNTTGTNSWGTSTLNTTNLNTNFINNIEIMWDNKIASITWKVGGNTSENIQTSPMNIAYQNEIVSSTGTYESKIGLMYVSDYGYAASSAYWTYLGYSDSGASYDYRAAIESNWMYMGLGEWTITRQSDTSKLNYTIFFVSSNGNISETDVGRTSGAVRPTFYLNSDVAIVGNHTGSKTDPYRIN